MSNNRLACFEPQEKTWKGESGQSFNLANLLCQQSDIIAPLHGLANFNASTLSHGGSYPHTLFRLPLRKHSSGLSENVYTVQRLRELLDALREEAKFLLLFLKSVNKIEVIHVSPTGQHSLSFRVEIAPANKQTICSHRERFMQQLQTAHKQQPYRISNVISFTARFSVIVTDHNPTNNKAGTSEWLVANYAGSADASVHTAAQKQKIFPWVGAALELGTSSAGGRIFCFLPMPVEASSGLPIHVNGTFGLNDERRTLKWPGAERRSDPTADWNKIVVSKLLPHCYAMLLCEAKKHLSHQQFYKAWPEVNAVKHTQFLEILQPLFASLFREAVVWTERTEALQQVGEWILITQATFISKGSNLASVVCRALSNCGVKLATIPSNIWAAIRHNRVGVTEVTPQLTRAKLRSYPQSYTNIDPIGKGELLRYCLSDRCYQDLSGLYLLPLANSSFTNFDYTYGAHVYLCTSDCPRSLLPNLDHMLVDLIDDTGLNSSLYEVASSQRTKLRTLTEGEVAILLPQAMPSDWQRSSTSLVVMPNAQLPANWFETFWKWLQHRNLQLFNNQLIIPVYQSTNQNRASFYITRLSTQTAVVYIGSYVSCSSSMLSALYKMNVMVCQQSEFSFVHHRQLAGYLKQFDTNGVLDAIAQQSTYSTTVFTQEQADGLRTFLISSTYAPNQHRRTVLQNLCIFSSAANTSWKLYSFSTGSTQSLARRVLGEPANSVLSVGNLPSNLVLLSRSNYHQLKLLKSLQVTFPTDTRLLLDHIFPLIQGRSFPDHLMDGLMTEVIDMFQVLNAKDDSLATTIKSLPFLKTVSGGRRSPKELFDPSNNNVKALYDGEDVFPLAPFNTAQRLQILRSQCGHQTTVSPQQVLDIISSISAASSSQPQGVSSTRFSRAKAVLEYISTSEFRRKTSGNYQLRLFRGTYSFSDALRTLATNRSWLPVMSSRPSEYPDQLSWKGSSFNCHFVSLTTSVAVVSQFSSQPLPCLVGTQMYIAVPSVHLTVANMLPTNAGSIVQHIVAHFRVTLACKEQLSVDELDMLVHRVYSYLNDNASYSRQLYSIQEWIFIKKQNKFVSPAVVALQQNQTFRQNLEPYVYILPDTLSQYTNLFSSSSAVSRSVSKSQILSALKMIRDNAQAFYPRSSAQEAWSTVMSILNWLTDNGTNDASVVRGEEVLVPVESESVWPKLKEASEVVYTDNDFLKTFLQDSEERDLYIFVHDKINSRLAKSLGVEPLSEFLDISEDTFEDAGQHEPLTVRLRNILRDYKDGLTIIKELLQNADDAEATEVNICYDARQHEVNPKKLFFSGMAEAHGPALIVHNNKTFTDEDFTNITKLAAATKQAKALKIGKFGVGFCSVYHMTDAPSFISRDRLYVFDPTLSYLRKEIKNPAQPGKKIGFTNKIIAKSGQLSPYDGLFGFNRSSSYEGTMFRLPFRTSASELSGTCYSEATVQELITAIQESSSSLLLFLQHVKCITFQRINQGETSPSVLLKVTRDSVPMPVALPAGIEVRRLSCSQTSLALTSDSKWLVSQQSESNWQGKYYTASVACLLRQTDNPSCFKIDPSFQGEIFCFLPLSQKTGLPVHVSSNFAVINNRRGIWTSDDATSQTDTEVNWNVALMQGVIPKAYHALLVALKQMKTEEVLQEYLFHCLWPLKENLEQHNPWSIMIPQLYQMISSKDLFYSTYQSQWLHLSASKFLQPGILSHSSKGPTTPSCVLTAVQHLNLPIVDIPGEYHVYFNLENLTIDEVEFTKIFFAHLQSLEEILTERNAVIQCMLEVYTTDYDNQTSRFNILDVYFRSCSCIPCCPEGKVLRKCDEVIDPSAEFADLYDSEEARFPIESLTKKELASMALHKLGMLCETIPWDMLIERAQTIPGLYERDKTKALERVILVLKSDTTGKRSSGIPCLSSIPFIPVLSKPSGYPIAWKGEGQELMCGKQLVIAETKVGFGRKKDDINIEVSGSQVVFVNEGEDGCGNINQKNIRLLEIRLSPTCDEVIQQFKELIEYFSSQTATTDLIARTDRMCRRIYEFLDGKSGLYADSPEPIASHTNQPDLQPLQSLPCVWTGKMFVTVKVIAKEWNREGPYLYPVPSSLSFRKHLSNALKIKEKFNLNDIQNALEQMSKDFEDSPVDEPCQEILKSLVPLLWNSELGESKIMLPDENYVMRWSNELAYNDAPYAPTDDKYTYVNGIIPRDLAKKLHVIPVRTKFLDKYCSKIKTHFRGSPFGQREDLTRRIQNILQGYPFDITVLKELLQNADDAKATKMYVILDKRTHGKTSVLSEDWAQLQGPALLVWNDSTFSEKDLQGIQELGLGSKRSDSESIGQYGIGFNVVYHLTDCPSFITGGDMCILDPHCRYVPGADVNDPGRRYDNLVSEGFWKDFPDMKSAYLQGGLQNCPGELQNQGSLFRFPLRHTHELVRMSEILQKDTYSSPKPLTADDMYTNLVLWAPQMKEAMFFLNHVKELRFFVIEESSNILETVNNYRTHVEPSAQQGREQLHSTLSAFKNVQGNESFVIRYPLSISDVLHTKDTKGSIKEHIVEEKWLIQQGVGDVENEQQTWKYVGNIKPRHGIAAPLQQLPLSAGAESGKSHEVKKCINGQLFCFLPLPVKSRLPVHINGHFILDSNRRELWHSTDADREDDKSAWNRNMFQAIASSYANFLEHAPSYYVSQVPYKTFLTAFDALNRYYSIFPCTYSEALDKQYLSLADTVYKKLVNHNASVLAVVHSDSSTTKTQSKEIAIKWCPLQSADPSTQIYFWTATLEGVPEYEKKHIKPIVESLGMQLTAAPRRLQHHLNKAIKEGTDKLKETTPSSVYFYYNNFCEQALLTGTTFPCTIDETIFKRVEVFKRFTDYLLEPSKTNVKEWEFPDHNPFDHPLLLTADSMLRRFSQDVHVLRSSYSHLFPKSLDKFLHPKLLKTDYSSKYFAHSSSIIDSILLVELRTELKTSRVAMFHQYLPKERLKSLWECFAKDSAFTSHLSNILNVWALIPAVDSHVFSYRHSFLPVFPPQEGHTYEVAALPSQSFQDIYAVLSSLTMPFLDLDTLSGASPECPSLEEHTKILKSLFYLAKENNLSALLDKNKVDVILYYLKSIDFRNDADSLSNVKSLPLFEIIDGTFTSLQGRNVFIWHSSASTVAYSKWVRTFNVSFLHYGGVWTVLGSPEQLKIDTISAEEIYYQYIFKVFFCLDERERYQHLEHIKKVMFARNKLNKDSSSMDQEYYRAVTFLSKLKELCCIGEDDKPLRPVGDFCDHTLKIFTSFKRRYRFLPEYFTSDPTVWKKWSGFFKELGLKQTVSKGEFIELCTETASSHEDPARACGVLLKHLFSIEVQEAGWYHDSSFVQQVSNIPFVATQSLPALCWIRESARDPSSRKVYKGEDVINLTKLSVAACPFVNKTACLWTVKPIINLDRYISYLSSERRKLVEDLGVTRQLRVADVIENLKNICILSRFIDFKHFDQYPDSNKPPEGAKSLMEVMISQFQFFQSKLLELTKNDKAILRGLPCIPVYSTFDAAHTRSWQVVLVKPCYVLTYDVKDYHPFLYTLPTELKPLLGILQEIGVETSLEIKHFQLVLKRAFQSSEGQVLEKNTKKCVVKALVRLEEMLVSRKSSTNLAENLAPLYLPDNNGKLALSTSLLYADVPSYKGRIKSQLDGTKYPLLQMSITEYGFFDTIFCDLLPESVKPRGLSEVCNQTVVPECEPISPCDIQTALQETLEMKNSLIRAIVACVKHHSKDKFKTENLERLLSEFLSSIKLVTVRHLRTAITIKECGTLIGTVDISFHLQIEDGSPSTSLCLYLDSKLDKVVGLNSILGVLTKKILTVIRKEKPNTDEITCSYLRSLFKSLLRVQTPDQVRQVLFAESIPLETKRMDDVVFELGKEVPECWHHRLDQTIENVFHPGEIVGYEDMDDHIIIAEIMHPVLPEGVESFDSVPRVSMRYRIFTSPEDEEGVEVSVLRLYKFLKGLKKEKPIDEDEKDLVLYEGETEPVRLQQQLRREDLEDIKSKLLKQLDDVWKLPQDERNRAIRRLYLKWHPDKNPDNPNIAEEVFKFLNSEIDRRKSGRIFRDDLNRAARRQRENYNQERYSFPTGQRGGSFGGGFQGGAAGGFGGTGWGGTSSGAPPFPEENLQPEINAEEGRRWVKQAEINFRSLVVLHSSSQNDPKLCADVCFMAHQVAEKALKGGKYYVCGLGEKALKSHNLTTHAYGLQLERPGETQGLVSHTAPLEVYYLNPRYPNRWPCPTVPADQYTSQQAEEAKNHAETILNIIKDIVE